MEPRLLPLVERLFATKRSDMTFNEWLLSERRRKTPYSKITMKLNMMDIPVGVAAVKSWCVMVEAEETARLHELVRMRDAERNAV